MTAFYAPTDLRWVDPRPTAAPTDDDEQVVRELLESRMTGDELTHALQLLGMLPNDRELNIGVRDSWARTTSKAQQEKQARSARECVNGHPRAKHSKLDRRGRYYCLTCKADEGLARRIANAERRKQEAT